MDITTAKALVKRALQELEVVLRDKENTLPRGQLLRFREELERMHQELESGALPPKDMRYVGMAHVIVDSWPLNTVLGPLIVKAEDAYINAGA